MAALFRIIDITHKCFIAHLDRQTTGQKISRSDRQLILFTQAEGAPSSFRFLVFSNWATTTLLIIRLSSQQHSVAHCQSRTD